MAPSNRTEAMLRAGRVITTCGMTIFDKLEQGVVQLSEAEIGEIYEAGNPAERMAAGSEDEGAG